MLKETAHKNILDKLNFKDEDIIKVDNFDTSFITMIGQNEAMDLTIAEYLYGEYASHEVFLTNHDKHQIFEIFDFLKETRSSVSSYSRTSLDYRFDVGSYSRVTLPIPNWFPHIQNTQSFSFKIEGEETKKKEKNFTLTDATHLKEMRSGVINALLPINDNRFLKQLGMVGREDFFTDPARKNEKYHLDLTPTNKDNFMCYSYSNQNLFNALQSRGITPELTTRVRLDVSGYYGKDPEIYLVTFKNIYSVEEVNSALKNELCRLVATLSIPYNVFVYENYTTIAYLPENRKLNEYQIFLPMNLSERDLPKLQLNVDEEVFRTTLNIRPLRHIDEFHYLQLYSVTTNFVKKPLEDTLRDNKDILENIK